MPTVQLYRASVASDAYALRITRARELEALISRPPH